MASIYGIDFGVGDAIDLVSIWRTVKGKDFETDALRTLVAGIPAELDDQSKQFPQVVGKLIYKKAAHLKFIFDDIVKYMAPRFNSYGQVASVYPDIAELMLYLGLTDAIADKHEELAEERRKSYGTWNAMCDERDGVGKTVWQQFGVADQSTVYAQ